MSNYHITQERLDKLLDKLIDENKISATEPPENNLVVIANAVLEEVLGEPVGEVDLYCKAGALEALELGVKLYAPKESQHKESGNG